MVIGLGSALAVLALVTVLVLVAVAVASMGQKAGLRPTAERFDEIAPAFRSIVEGACTVPTADGSTYTFQTDGLVANGFDQQSCVIAGTGKGLLSSSPSAGCAVHADLPQYSWANPFNGHPAVAGVAPSDVRGVTQCTVALAPSATAQALADLDRAIDIKGAALTSGSLQLQSLLDLTTLTLNSTSAALGTASSSLSQTTGTLDTTADALSTAESDIANASAKYAALQAASATAMAAAQAAYTKQLTDATTDFSNKHTADQIQMAADASAAKAAADGLNGQINDAASTGAANAVQLKQYQSQLGTWTSASAVTTTTLYAGGGFGGATWTPPTDAASYQQFIKGAFQSVSVPSGQTFVGFPQDKLSGAPWTVVGPGIAPKPPASWTASGASLASCQVTTTGTVTVFFDCDFGQGPPSQPGQPKSSTLVPNKYGAAGGTGLPDKSISSVLVSPGAEITLYDQPSLKGNSVLLSASVACLTGVSAGLPSGSWNDVASSCEVVSTNAAPALGLPSPIPLSTVTIQSRCEDTCFDGMIGQPFCPAFAISSGSQNDQLRAALAQCVSFQVDGGSPLTFTQIRRNVWPPDPNPAQRIKDVVQYGPSPQQFQSYSSHTFVFMVPPPAPAPPANTCSTTPLIAGGCVPACTAKYGAWANGDNKVNIGSPGNGGICSCTTPSGCTLPPGFTQ